MSISRMGLEHSQHELIYHSEVPGWKVTDTNHLVQYLVTAVSEYLLMVQFLVLT